MFCYFQGVSIPFSSIFTREGKFLFFPFFFQAKRALFRRYIHLTRHFIILIKAEGVGDLVIWCCRLFIYHIFFFFFTSIWDELAMGALDGMDKEESFWNRIPHQSCYYRRSCLVRTGHNRQSKTEICMASTLRLEYFFCVLLHLWHTD